MAAVVAALAAVAERGPVAIEWSLPLALPRWLAQPFEGPFPEGVGDALGVGIGTGEAHGAEVKQRRQEARARVRREIAGGGRDPGVVARQHAVRWVALG